VYAQVLAQNPRAVHGRVPLQQRKGRRRLAEGPGEGEAQGSPRPIPERVLRAASQM